MFLQHRELLTTWIYLTLFEKSKVRPWQVTSMSHDTLWNGMLVSALASAENVDYQHRTSRQATHARPEFKTCSTHDDEVTILQVYLNLSITSTSGSNLAPVSCCFFGQSEIAFKMLSGFSTFRLACLLKNFRRWSIFRSDSKEPCSGTSVKVIQMMIQTWIKQNMIQMMHHVITCQCSSFSWDLTKLPCPITQLCLRRMKTVNWKLKNFHWVAFGLPMRRQRLERPALGPSHYQSDSQWSVCPHRTNSPNLRRHQMSESSREMKRVKVVTIPRWLFGTLKHHQWYIWRSMIIDVHMLMCIYIVYMYVKTSFKSLEFIPRYVLLTASNLVSWHAP